MRVPEQVLRCVAFVGTATGPGTQAAVSLRGTAFFLAMPAQGLPGAVHHIYLVTARHVARGLDRRPLYVRANGPNGTATWIGGTTERWWFHPSDQRCDVAILPWAPPRHLIDYRYVPVDILLAREEAGRVGIGPGDEVVMTGLFSQMVGKSKNMPIVRAGNIAMMAEEPVPTEEGEMEAFLVEARSIGGSSGSPVFVHAGEGGALLLLGLVHGHWDVPVNTAAESTGAGVIHGVNVGIAIVVPAWKIREVLEQSALVEQRAAAVAEYRSVPLRGTSGESERS